MEKMFDKLFSKVEEKVATLVVNLITILVVIVVFFLMTKNSEKDFYVYIASISLVVNFTFNLSFIAYQRNKNVENMNVVAVIKQENENVNKLVIEKVEEANLEEAQSVLIDKVEKVLVYNPSNSDQKIFDEIQSVLDPIDNWIAYGYDFSCPIPQRQFDMLSSFEQRQYQVKYMFTDKNVNQKFDVLKSKIAQFETDYHGNVYTHPNEAYSSTFYISNYEDLLIATRKENMTFSTKRLTDAKLKQDNCNKYIGDVIKAYRDLTTEYYGTLGY